MNSKDKDDMKEAIYSVAAYKLHDAIDVIKTCEGLANNN